jgi:hypothetical protein
MRRRLFNAAAVVSLALCLSTLVAAARSFARTDDFAWLKMDDAGAYYFGVVSGRAGLSVAFDAELYEKQSQTDAPAARPAGKWSWQDHGVGPPRRLTPPFNTGERTRFGFWFKWTHTADTIRREIILPYWFLTVFTGLLPILWLTRRRDSLRRRRLAAGLCTRCGYDLRASPDNCPECGAPAVRV